MRDMFAPPSYLPGLTQSDHVIVVYIDRGNVLYVGCMVLT